MSEMMGDASAQPLGLKTSIVLKALDAENRPATGAELRAATEMEAHVLRYHLGVLEKLRLAERAGPEPARTSGHQRWLWRITPAGHGHLTQHPAGSSPPRRVSARGPSPEARKLLRALVRRGGRATAGALATAMAQPGSSVRSALLALERHGLLARDSMVQQDGGPAAWLWSITDAGMAEVADAGSGLPRQA